MDLLHRWLLAMSTHFKSVDHRHLLTVGSEGERERERECECVCVCVCLREGGREGRGSGAAPPTCAPTATPHPPSPPAPPHPPTHTRRVLGGARQHARRQPGRPWVRLGGARWAGLCCKCRAARDRLCLHAHVARQLERVSLQGWGGGGGGVHANVCVWGGGRGGAHARCRCMRLLPLPPCFDAYCPFTAPC